VFSTGSSCFSTNLMVFEPANEDFQNLYANKSSFVQAKLI
jgi:hypothetical protein